VARASLGLGSNLGDRESLLNAAIESLDWGDVRVVGRSSMYETEPVGGPGGQPWFLNMAIAIETMLSPHTLWERCAAVEIALGRAHTREERWGPRTIDIDVLLYGDAIVSDEDLIVPHPRLHERAFVLIPLLELDPALSIPGRGPAADLLARIDDQVVRPYTP
jgi:2-amino-4-hydroxy-6-hydroxymethyldihydropteridine diphosphokinase